jgi:hypothetical protein
MNHIATGRALSLGGEILPPHHGRQQQQWRWRWSRWRWLRGQLTTASKCCHQFHQPSEGGSSPDVSVTVGECEFFS